MKKMVLCTIVLGTALLQGCATYPNAHGGQSAGVRASGDVDVLGVGVDAAVQVGVHPAGDGVVGNRGILRAPPCEGALAALESSQGLISWASNGGQGLEERRADATARESNGRASYSCFGNNRGQSRQINGQESPPIRIPTGQIPQAQPFIPSEPQGRYYGR